MTRKTEPCMSSTMRVYSIFIFGTHRINVDNPHSTFITHDESFRLRYETAISNAHDFLPEFDAAYQSLARPWMNSTDFIHTWKGIIQTNQQTIKVALDLNNR